MWGNSFHTFGSKPTIPVSPAKYERSDLMKNRAEIDPQYFEKLSPPETTPALPPWFALVDMNSYFAVLEQQANPHLRGKPIGIVKERGRSCIIAASPEAKKLGVHTGERLYDARQKAPNIITIPADFDKYFYNTKKLIDIFKALSPDVELFSLDEAFIDLSSCRALYPTPESFFQAVRKAVKAQLGSWVIFSLGLGANRLQAKLASEFAGKDNYFEITKENLAGCLMDAKVEEICGIGYRLTAKLHALQITHPYQLNFYDDAFLLDHFGIFWGPELRRIGRGEDSHLLTLIDKPPKHMKSVGRSKTLFIANGDRAYLRQLITNLAEDACFKARRMKLGGHTVSLYLNDVDGRSWGGHRKLKGVVCHTNEMCDILDGILDELGELPAAIIKAGVQLGELQPLEDLTICWLPEWNRQQKVYEALDKVNEKYGLYTLKSGRLMDFKIMYPEVTGFLGDKQYQMQFAN